MKKIPQDTWLMTSWTDCSRMPTACSELQESSRKTLMSRFSGAGIGSVEPCEANSGVLSLATYAERRLEGNGPCLAGIKHTRLAGVEHQAGLGRLQQPLDEATGENGRREDDGPLRLDPHWLDDTVRDQVVLVAW